MNFDTTNIILDALKAYFINSNITISTDNKDYTGRNIICDLVTIDRQNNVGFEVFENEIIVFYFMDHTHFKDYSSELEAGEDDYIKMAKNFLVDIFENKIKYVQKYKGEKRYIEEYYIIRLNSEENIGRIFCRFKPLFNPFAKKSIITVFLKFNKAKGVFEKL